MDRLLTKEEKIVAQENLIKDEQKKTGIILHFPLDGYTREECLLKAQEAKTLKAVGEWLYKQIAVPHKNPSSGDRSDVFILYGEIQALKRGEWPGCE